MIFFIPALPDASKQPKRIFLFFLYTYIKRKLESWSHDLENCQITGIRTSARIIPKQQKANFHENWNDFHC